MDNHIKSWYALYTRSKHERKIENSLIQSGISAFLPMCTEIREWSDRKKKMLLPLFPNYLFVQIDSNSFWKAKSLSGVVRFVGIGGRPTPVPDGVIESLQMVNKEKLHVEELNFEMGDRVMITNGKFIGVEGVFIRRGGKNLLAIGVEIMNRVVVMELRGEDVQKLQPLLIATAS